MVPTTRACWLLPLLSSLWIAEAAGSFADCGGCFCIPSDGSCPTTRQPPKSFDFVDNLKSLLWDNPIGLNCNPYSSPSCALEFSDASTDLDGNVDAFCVVSLQKPANDTASCPTNWTYTVQSVLQSETTEAELHRQGKFITHYGKCGACSSLQDLAVYMEQGANLRQESTTCGATALTSGNDDAGRMCFTNLGFSEGCAEIWLSNTVNTREQCLDVCATFLISGTASNGAPPTCPLATCLECDETKSGPVFAQFAGRTRRNSGLQSNIARPCSEMPPLLQFDPCLEAPFPTLEPTPSPTTSLAAKVSVVSATVLWASTVVALF